jgi:tetratricopeptide (TPR) repeat protein
LEPNFSVSYWNLGQNLREKGMLEGAVVAFDKADKLSGGNQIFRSALAHTLAISGEKERASEILEEFKKNSMTQYVAPHAMLMICIGLGEFEQALTWFERSYEERSDFVIEASVNPAVDPLRQYQRFQDLMKRLSF